MEAKLFPMAPNWPDGELNQVTLSDHQRVPFLRTRLLQETHFLGVKILPDEIIELGQT